MSRNELLSIFVKVSTFLSNEPNCKHVIVSFDIEEDCINIKLREGRKKVQQVTTSPREPDLQKLSFGEENRNEGYAPAMPEAPRGSPKKAACLPPPPVCHVKSRQKWSQKEESGKENAVRGTCRMTKVSPLKQLKPAAYRTITPSMGKSSLAPRSRLGEASSSSISAIRMLSEGEDHQVMPSNGSQECFLTVSAATPPPLKRMSYSMAPPPKRTKSDEAEPSITDLPTPPLTPYPLFFVAEPGKTNVDQGDSPNASSRDAASQGLAASYSRSRSIS